MSSAPSSRPFGPPTPARWRGTVWRLTPVIAIAIGLVLARLGPGPFATAGATAAIATAGAAGVGAARIGLRGFEVVVVGAAIAVAVVGALSLVLYVLTPPTQVALVVLVGSLGLGPVAFALRPPPQPRRVSDTRWLVVVVLGVAAAGMLAAAAGPYFPALWDGPYHAATLRQLIESPTWAPASPYFPPQALPVPQYGLDPWYPLLGIVSVATGFDALDTVRWIAPAVGALGVAAATALAAAATEACGAGRWARSVALVLTPLLVIAVEGIWGGFFAWRTGYLPQQAAASILLPATLLVMIRFTSLRRVAGAISPAVLCGLLVMTSVLMHLVVGVAIAAVAAGELTVLAAVAIVGRRRARSTGRAARSRPGALAAVGVVAVALGAGAALTLPPLLAMTHLAGPADFGNPAFASQIRHVGPWIMLRPALLVGSWMALAGLATAAAAVVLGWRRPGIRSLALGTIVAWAVVFFPPAATIVAELASSLYLRRLAAIPAALAVPLVGATVAVAAGVVARRRRRHAPRKAAARRLVPLAAMSTLVVIVVALGTILAAKPPRDRPPWLPSVAWDRILQGDESGKIRRLAAELGGSLPAGSVVLSDPATSYWLPAVLDVRVVAVPATHSLSTDPARISVRGRTRAGTDVQRYLQAAGLSIEDQTAILERYAVTHVVLAPRRSHRAAGEFEADRQGTIELVARDLGADHLAIYVRRR